MKSKNGLSLPPKYEDVLVEMGDLGHNNGQPAPTAPPPGSPLHGFGFSNWTTVKIVKEERDLDYGPFKFFIRDGNTDRRLFRGSAMVGSCASITEIDGTLLIKFAEIDETNPFYIKDNDLFNFAQFCISRQNKFFGVLAIKFNNAKLTFVNEQGIEPYLFKLTKDKETVLVYRNDSNDLLAMITCPESKKEYPFQCTIGFNDENCQIQPMDMEEKEFIISTAVAYMTSRNGPMLSRLQNHIIFCFVFLIAIGIIIGLVYIFICLLRR